MAKRMKLNVPGAKSKTGTPIGSRAGSPTPAGKAVTGSRASSPESSRGKFLQLYSHSLLYPERHS